LEQAAFNWTAPTSISDVWSRAGMHGALEARARAEIWRFALAIMLVLPVFG
jgi:hypothetical protein